MAGGTKPPGQGTWRGGMANRRRVVASGLAFAVGLPLFADARRAPSMATIATSALSVQAEPPPDLGQTALQVFLPRTGHTLGGTLLDYWRATGGAAVFGDPISEPFTAPDGRYSQAFENAILQYRPDVLYTEDPIIRPMALPRTGEATAADLLRPDRRRGGGGGTRRNIYSPVDPAGAAVAAAYARGGRYDETTGHTLSGAFAAWYDANEGQFYFGGPTTEPIEEPDRIIQHFEGGILIEDADGVRLAPIGQNLATGLEVDTAPVAQNGLPVYDEALFQTAPNPAPAGDPAAPGRRRIEVNVGQQQLWAYQGETLVLTTLVSTGIEPNETELGRFRVRIKYPQQDMAGFTDDTGEVVAFGDDPELTPPPESVASYDVSDVPNVLYINLDAEALHGAYWHANFGQRMSHGCINLPLEVAAFLYGWAPLGTEVWVHE